MPTKCLYVALVALVTIADVVLSQAPITWPDPRHFKISLERYDGLTVTATWQVEEYCHQNKRLEFNAFATGPDGLKIDNEPPYYYRNQQNRIIELKRRSTKYIVTGTTKTLFDPRKITVNLTVVSGGPAGIGGRQSRPVQQLSSARSRGNGPHIVVLKDNTTQECLLVIYDNKTTTETYSIEGTNQCRKGSLPKISVLLPMTVESEDYLPDLKLLKFHLPQKYLNDLPDFFVNTDTIQKDSTFELDPPQDVYGKLTLVSPEKARLVLKFRPPASHPKLINSFTFEFSNQNEKIIYKIKNDGVNTSIDERHIITMSHLIHVQENPSIALEVFPQNNYTYPSNYTVTVYTNDAWQKKHIIPIIMPNFVTLAPRDSKIEVREHSATLSWEEPHLFGSSCNYLASAKPIGDKGITLSASTSSRSVDFNNLSPATEYNFILKTTCSTGKSIITVLGTRKTGPREPGMVRNLKIRVVKVGVVQLSWDPPQFMEGDSHIYNFACKHHHADDPHSGRTPNTTVTIENVASGTFSCVVSTTSSVKGHKERKGRDCDAVSVYMPSNLISSIPTVSIKRTSKTVIDLKIEIEEESGIIAVIVGVDPYLLFSFYTDTISNPIEITNLRSSNIKVERKGLTSFLLTHLTEDKTYTVTVTYLFFISEEVKNTYIITPDFESSPQNSTDELRENKPDTGKEDQNHKIKLSFVITFAIILFALVVGISIWQYKKWRSKNGSPLLGDVDDQ